MCSEGSSTAKPIRPKLPAALTVRHIENKWCTADRRAWYKELLQEISLLNQITLPALPMSQLDTWLPVPYPDLTLP